MKTIVNEDETVELDPRISFKQECPRCHFKHARGKACPKCSDTSELDTGWADNYTIAKNKAGKLSVILAVLTALFHQKGGV